MPDKQKIQYKEYNDFSSGYISEAPSGDSRIPQTAIAYCKNVDFTEYGTIKNRKGYVQLGSGDITDSGSIQGLHYFGNQNQLLAVINKGLYKWDFDDATPSWSMVTKTFTGDLKTEFANALNYCWITNNSDTPQRFDGTTMTDSGTGTAPDDNRPLKAEFVIFKHNRLWYADITESDSGTYTSRLRYSGLRAIEGADAWDIDAWFDFEQDDGDNITGLKGYRNNIVVTKNNSLSMIKGTSNVDFGQFNYSTKIGCVAGRTIQEIDENLLFLNRKYIYVFDGMSVKPFSTDVIAEVNELDQSEVHKSAAIYYDNKYICATTLLGQNVNISFYVYNFLSKSWTNYFNSPTLVGGQFAIYSPNEADSKLYFASNRDGTDYRRVYELFSGNQDDGTDISSYFTTSKFNCDTPHRIKQFNTVWAYADGHPSDSLTIQYKLDYTLSYDTGWSDLGTFALSDHIKKMKLPAGKNHKGRNIQFKVSNTSSYTQWEFKGFVIEYEDFMEAS